MSTIPLSRREGYMQTISGEDPKEIDHHAESNAAINGYLERTLADLPDDDAETSAPKRKSLDDIIDGAMAKADEPDDFEDFRKSREHREELRERHGANASRVIDVMSDFGEKLQIDPVAGTDYVRSIYTRDWSVGKARHAEERAKRGTPTEAASEPAEPEHWMKKLDRVLEGAIEENYGDDGDGGIGAREKREFAAVKPKFEEIRKVDPSLNYQDFFANAAKFDREATINPDYAVNLAAPSGAPMTPLLQEAAALKQQDESDRIARAEAVKEMHDMGFLPHFESVRADMVKLLDSPEWKRSADWREAVKEAYDAAVWWATEQRRARA